MNNLRLENDLAEMIIVTIRVDNLHQVVKDLEFLEEFDSLQLLRNKIILERFLHPW